MRQYKFSPVSVLVVGALLCSPLATHAEFKQSLQYGMTNSVAVKDLQDFLTAEGYYSGKITGSYFSFTKRAVRAFQTENGIEPATGIFGSLTRARANEILAADIASSSAPGDTSDASSTDSTTTDASANTGAQSSRSDSFSSTIQDLLGRVQALEEIIAELTAPAPSTPTYTSTNTTPTTSTTTKTTTTTATTTTKTATTTTATTTVRR